MSDEVLVPTSSNDQALALLKNQEYFPRLKLCQGSAQEVNQNKVARGGNYALIHSKESIVDLGDEIESVVVAVRTKALRTGDEILQYFDPECQEFKDIIQESQVKDSECMYGPEYLLYIPSESCFATLFLCSKSSRRVATDLHKLLGKAAILGSTLIETKKYSWWGNTFSSCATPITNLPEREEILSRIEQFQSERPSEVKKVAPAAANTDRAV